MWKAFLVALAVTLVAGSRALAQGAYLGPQLGFYNAVDADNPRVMPGAALRLKLSPGLGLEGSINYRKEDYADSRVSVQSWPVMVTGLFYPIPILYGAIGAGWYNSRFEYDATLIGATIESETKQQFGWHFGGGVELPIGRNAKLVGDIRYVFLNYDFKQVPGFSGLDADFYVITAGLLFRL